jgi:D-beta-D-heptose 7-phosphate kinase/D-beta-D-heptose 1-phosphate adenosyltransferase
MEKIKETIVIVSGYFNPLHKGHLDLFKKAKTLGTVNRRLLVIVNSDLQRELKGSKEFMLEEERLEIISSLKDVNFSMLSIDKDKTQRETLKYIRNLYPNNHLVFANGGDQTNQSIPESETCKQLDIELVDRLGDKIQSSSWLVK